MNKYIYWNENLEIRKFLDNTIVLVIKGTIGKGMPTSKSMQRTYTVNDTAAEIIQLIDGTKTYEEIISFLSSKYNENFESIKEKILSFLDNISKSYNISINTREYPKKKSVNLVEKRTMYPTVASVELTNKCNIRCMHCYGNFGNKKEYVMSLDKAKTLLSDLKNIGVTTVELTGGEITVHPNIKEILLNAINLKFNQISLLTNGIALSNEIIDIIIKNKSMILVQIDLHSLDDNYLTWFAKVPNTLNLIKSKIIKLAENNVKMRIATVVTHKNIDELEGIADWVHSLGIDHYGVSPVVSLGRAVNSDSNLFINIDDAKKLEKKLEQINNKYENLLSLIDVDRSKNKNCGCLTSHAVISPNGDIKICTMDNLEYFNSSIGNVFEKNLKDIYDDNADYINAFFNMSSPKINSLECEECKNKNFCNGCLVRGLVKSKEIGSDCKWYINKIPKIIKDRLELQY